MGGINSRFRSLKQRESDAIDILEDLPPLEEVDANTAYAFASCSICFEQLRSCVLACGHTVCEECLQSQLTQRWPGDRVTFGYLSCGVCRAQLAHESITQQLQNHWNLMVKVAEVALRGARDNGLMNVLYTGSRELITPESERQYALDRMVVHQCSECQDPFCAGVVDCARLLENTTSQSMPRCPACVWKASTAPRSRKCELHGPKFAIYKCDFCCTLAVWQCGQAHFCESCHNFQPREHFCCSGPEECPLGIAHPPNGSCSEGFVFGCSACAGCLEPNCVYVDYVDYDPYDNYLDPSDDESTSDCHIVEEHRLLADVKRVRDVIRKARRDAHLSHLRKRSQDNADEARSMTKRTCKYKKLLLERNSADFCVA